jgi:HD-GYP domain-containing protein (c-di-GMP phosphodiesterase class II)
VIHPESGITLRHATQGIEKVSLKGLELSLVAAGDGTEIIHHRLAAGSRWAMEPAEGWNALEALFIISGNLRWQLPGGDRLLQAGDTISASPIQASSIFIAQTDVEFLYITSQPVFHFYSKSIREMMDLAVEIELKDGYTADHCQRIKNLSTMLGEGMNLSSSELLELNFGSFLHDIGKTMVPDSILGKPGKLTPEEWGIMKLHTIYGRQKLHETGLPNLIKPGFIVEQHHERFDGSGYPNGLQGENIKIGAAIVAVVDSYDAMTSNRVYQKGRSKEEALEEILRCRETMYHPDVVDVFLSLFNKID